MIKNNKGYILIETLLNIIFTFSLVYAIIFIPLELKVDYNIYCTQMEEVYNIEIISDFIYKNYEDKIKIENFLNKKNITYEIKNNKLSIEFGKDIFIYNLN